MSEFPDTVIYDVIVAGGGPAGCIAAAASAREGAKTLLLESGYTLGGMSTSGLVTCFAPYTDGEKLCYGGIALEVLEKIKKKTYGVKDSDYDWVPTNPEALKRIYDDLVTESGVDVLFGTMFCDVEMDDSGKIDSILCANKKGIKKYKARVYIDCTGDADIAFRAGVPCSKGSEEGDLQPASLCFIMTGINDEKLKESSFSWVDPGAPIHKIVACGDYPDIQDNYMLQPDFIAPGTVGFNAGHLFESDGSDPAQVSRSVIRGRRIAEQISEGLKRFAPEVFGNASLVETASVLGIRETRRITGDYVITLKDYVEKRSFEDDIGRNCYAIDVHAPVTKNDDASDTDGTSCEGMDYIAYGKGESHGIPYRSLLPVGTVNLLVAGRSISTERLVNSSVRVMPCCMVTAQAAGTAAALSLRCGGVVRDISITELQNKLKDNKCIL